MSEEAPEYKAGTGRPPRCRATHWYQGEELRCIDVEGHASAHYNVVWWPNTRGLPRTGQSMPFYLTPYALALALATLGLLGIGLAIYHLLPRP